MLDRPIAFDRFRVDRSRRQLLRDGKPVPLNGKTFDVLIALLSGQGSVLTREELYQRLWPDGVVEDGNLSQNIYLLRRALDPGGDGRAYIETIPRIGYRFEKPIKESTRPGHLRQRLGLGAVACAIAGLLVAGIFSARSNANALPSGARDAYALGVYHLGMRSPQNLTYALGYFQQTIRLAPRNASGYAGEASANALLAEFEGDRAKQNRQVALAEQERDRALARDPNSAEALAVSGFIAYRFKNDRATAERYLERAVAQDAGDAAAHHWYGVVLLMRGRLPAAIAQFEDAHRLQPTSEVFSRWLARAYTYARRPDDAIVAATQAIRIERSDAPAWLALACAQEQQGRLRDALQSLATLGRLVPYEQRFVVPDEARLEVILQRNSSRALARKIDRLVAENAADPFETALFLLTIGRKDRANDVLRSAMQPDFLTAVERFDPRFVSLTQPLS